MKPRLINCLPSYGSAAGGDLITIAGKDIDVAATVDFYPLPGGIPVAAAIVSFVSLPNGIQHLTVQAPICPPLLAAGVYFNRKSTIRVTNPPGTEWGTLERAFTYQFVDETQSFLEIGEVVFKPERMLQVATGNQWFPSYTWNSNLWRYSYEFTADAAGVVDFKALRPALTKIREPHFGDKDYFGPVLTRGVIRRVVCEPTVIANGWNAKYFDDANIDVFHGLGTALSNAGAVDFIPVLYDGYGDSSEPIALHDWMRFNITNAGANGTGKVHVYFTAV